MHDLAAPRLQQAQNHPCQCRFPGTALSKQTENLAMSDREVYIVDHFTVCLLPGK